MRASKNSESSRTSKKVSNKPALKKPVGNQGVAWRHVLSAVATLLLIGSGAAWWVYRHGYTLYYGDAEAHLNNARRILDSRTPTVEQVGTVWLPLPHLLMMPFAGNNHLWQSGLAGVFPSVAAFVIGGLLLFLSVWRLLGGPAAAWTALVVFALNPNLLYLQSVPMTEALFFACLCGILWCSLQDGALGLIGLLVASNAASLTRYEGWFLIPFVAVYVWIKSKSAGKAILFASGASIGPLAWLIHNQVYWHDPLEFYWGQWSAKAIYARQLASGMAPYPGDHDWSKAWEYFSAAVRATIHPVILMVAAAGVLLAFWKRAWWPVVLLLLAPGFYLWSMHGSGTPIFLPTLPPFSWYNTRYGLAALPLVAVTLGAAVCWLPRKVWMLGPTLGVCLSALPYLASSQPSICWRESEVNSEERRAWQHQTGSYLSSVYRGGGILASLGSLSGSFREAGIPIREVLHEGNHPAWDQVILDPSSATERWAMALPGDPIDRVMKGNPAYRLTREITVGSSSVRLYSR